MEHFATYYMWASIGLTAAHKIVESLHAWAVTTPASEDDAAIEKIAGVLAALDGLLGFFAVRLEKRTPGARGAP